MKLPRIHFFSYVLLAMTTPAIAQISPPPTITLVESERRIEAGVIADGDSGEGADVTVNTIGGPFASVSTQQRFGLRGSNGNARAEQASNISAFSIIGSGSAEAAAALGGESQSKITSAAGSGIITTFTVPVDTPYSLDGSFTASGFAGGSCLGKAGVTLMVVKDDQPVAQHEHYFDCDDPEENSPFFFEGNVTAGTTFYLDIGANVVTQGDQFFDGTGSGAASFNMNFNVGDSDGDGLLDTWEEEGIDVDNDGIPEIDLPAMGANRLKKDLFVEVDVMAAVPFDQQSLDLVINAFAQAPADMIVNPDGSTGITLHVIHDDGDVLPFQSVAALNDADFFAQLRAIKSTYFGSAADRNHPLRSAILEARDQIFRYCLWGDTLVVSGKSSLGGIGELPGKNFMIAAGTTSDLQLELKIERMAGVFMHELGHTLGLQHGGKDDINNKPNYLSVMNYQYTIPVNKITEKGNNVKEVWVLDYSRSSMMALDETALVESDGLDGPVGRKIYFNSSFELAPDPIVLAIALANSSQINWNNNDDPAQSQSYQQDISRMWTGSPVSFENELKSYSDWDRLWYTLVEYQAIENVAELPLATDSVDLELEFFEALIAEDFVDQTPKSALIFKDSFESPP